MVFLRRNVFDNIAFPLRVKGKRESYVKQRVNYLLTEFNIFDKKSSQQEVCRQEMLSLFHLLDQLLMTQTF